MKQGYRRLVCGLLAVQLCCAPLAQAAEPIQELLEQLPDITQEQSMQTNDTTVDDKEKSASFNEVGTTVGDGIEASEDKLTDAETTGVTDASGTQPDQTTPAIKTDDDKIGSEDGDTESETGDDKINSEADSSDKAGDDITGVEVDATDMTGDDKIGDDSDSAEKTDEDKEPATETVVNTKGAALRSMSMLGGPLRSPGGSMPENFGFVAVGRWETSISNSYTYEGDSETVGYLLQTVNEKIIPADQKDWFYLLDVMKTYFETYPLMRYNSFESVVTPPAINFRIPDQEPNGWQVRLVERVTFDRFTQIASGGSDAIEFPDSFDNSKSVIAFSESEGAYSLDLSNGSVQLTLKNADNTTYDATEESFGEYYIVYFTSDWLPSTDARATSIALHTNPTPVTYSSATEKIAAGTIDDPAAASDVTLYSTDIQNTPMADLSGEVAFSEGEKDAEPVTYYSRVNADITSVQFTIETREPGSTVTVSQTGEGVSVVDLTARHPSYPEGGTKVNSLTNPARGLWRVTVPLNQATSAAPYNEIEITVKAPSGAEKKYTFNIQRLAEPHMTYASGNTPTGTLAALGTRHETTYAFATDRKYTETQANVSLTDGTPLYRGEFTNKAWPGYGDADTDRNAIVVYQNSKVYLPALTLTDSRGKTSELTGTFTRSLELKQAAGALTTDVTKVDSGNTDVTLSGSVTINGGDESEELDLTGRNVVPGIYYLEYRYVDPIAGRTYTSSAAVGTDWLTDTGKTANALTFHRTLVVLPIRGDVDMDGYVTPADAMALDQLLAEATAAEKTIDQYVEALFLYRVCDFNNDGSVTGADAAAIRTAGTVRVNDGNGHCDYFYLPLTEVSPAIVTRQDMPTPVTTQGSNDRIFLSYLGVEKTEGANTTVDSFQGVQKNNTFWVGVTLERKGTISAKTGKAYSFTATVSYDPSYVVPGRNGNSSSAEELILEKAEEYWGDGAVCTVLPLEASLADDAKAVPGIGSENDVTTLKQIRVTVVTTSGKDLTGGNLLQIPFTLKKFNSQDAPMVELVLGPRELVFDGERGQALYSTADGLSLYGGTSWNLKDLMDYGGTEHIPMAVDSTAVTKPENWPSELVYGESFSFETQANLGNSGDDFPDWLVYTYDITNGSKLTGTPHAAELYDFYIGPNRYQINVTKKDLHMAVYDRGRYYGEANPEVKFTYTVADLTTWDVAALKEATGKAELTGSSDELSSALSGYHGPDFNYVETVTASANGVDVTEDTDVGSYFVVMSGGTLKNYRIIYEVGAESIGGSFNETPVSTAYTNATGKSWATLTIHKRPILVDQLQTIDPVPTTDEKKLQYRYGGFSGVYTSKDETQFTVVLPATSEGKYGSYPLVTGENVLAVHVDSEGQSDKLEISYSVEYVRDHEGDPYFTLTQPVEMRNVIFYQMSFKSGQNDNNNYELVNDVEKTAGLAYLGMQPVVKVGEDMGKVIKQYMTELTLTNLTGTIVNREDADARAAMTMTHGDSLAEFQNGIGAAFHWNDDAPDSNPHNVSSTTIAENEITAFWARLDTETDKPTGTRYPLSGEGRYDNVSLKDLNGFYLWVARDSLDSEGNDVELTDHSAYPLNVSKKVVVLSLEPETRYYGEPNLADEKTEVTYTVTDLAKDDQAGKTGAFQTDFPDSGLQISRLTMLTGGEAVRPWTQVGDNYYVTISGATDVNYEFHYQHPNNTGTLIEDAQIGYRSLSVKPRPIIVSKVTATPAFIYADADKTDVENQNATTADGKVTLLLPTQGSSYAVQTTNSVNEDGNYGVADESETITMPLTGTPLYGGDAEQGIAPDQLTFTYTGVYIRDNPTNKPYFTLNASEEPRNVAVTCITIKGDGSASDRSRNYALVFTATGNAEKGYPGTGTNIDQTEYLTTGTVKVRAVSSIEVVSQQHKLSYQHGDALLLNADQGAGREALKIRINYRGGDIPPDYVTFDDWSAGGKFAKSRLHVTWDIPWNSAIDNSKVINSNLELTHAYENGRPIYVTLEQLSGLDPIPLADPLVLTVAKKPLTLTATDIDRYYGEGDGTHRFTFPISQLSGKDKALLDAWVATNSISESDKNVGTAAASAALEAINSPYQNDDDYIYSLPTFTSIDRKSMAGGGNGPGGAYTLKLEGGELTNYDVETVDGNIRVFKRPLIVNKIVAERIATLSAAEETNLTLSTHLTQTGGGTSRITFKLPGTGTYQNNDDSQFTAGKALPLDAGGPPLLVDDSVTITFRVTFPASGNVNRPDMTNVADGKPCPVEIDQMVLSEGKENYILIYEDATTKNTRSPVDKTASGWLSARKMTKVQIVGAQQTTPMRMTGYTYGDTLSAAELSKIVLWVEYDNGDKGPVTYDKMEAPAELFYWDPNIQPVPTQTGPALDSFVTLLHDSSMIKYKASIGDRLVLSSDGEKLEHQGKLLLLLYRANSSSGAAYLPPVLASDQTFEIAKKPLTYSVTANSRAYNPLIATTTGSLTLDPSSICEGDMVYAGSGIRYTFVDADGNPTKNVAYVTEPTSHSYGTIADIQVMVENINITGKDAGNYEINQTIPRDWVPDFKGRPNTPTAKITKAIRSAPVLDEILLTTDINTNAITVDPGRSVIGNILDERNAGVHFEYSLECSDGDGGTIYNGWQDATEFASEANGMNLLTRDTWYRARVRIGETWNYLPSGATYSVGNPTGSDLEALALQFQNDLETYDAANPGDPKEPPEARPPWKMAKTYHYKINVYTVNDRKNDSEPIVPNLEAVWFTDIGTFTNQQELDRVVDNTDNKRLYYDYYWDETKRTRVVYPLDISGDLIQEIEVKGESGTYAKEPVTVNSGQTISIYAMAKPTGGGVLLVQKLIVDQDRIVAAQGDEPIQLSVTYVPVAAMHGLQWKSSDPDVVQVDDQGWISFVGVGTAVITVLATYGGVSAQILVEVAETRPVQGDTFVDMSALEAYMDLDSGMQFHPKDTMTRGEVVEILYAIFRVPKDAVEGEPVAFNDVDGSESFAEAVQTMSSYGIIVGFREGKKLMFHGEQIITRAEAVVLLARMLRILPETDLSTPVFIDGGPEDTWAAPYLNPLYQEGIIRGMGHGYFCPKLPMTRAELATIIARSLMTRADQLSNELVIPTDVEESYWAYDDILRAINRNKAVVPLEIIREGLVPLAALPDILEEARSGPLPAVSGSPAKLVTTGQPLGTPATIPIRGAPPGVQIQGRGPDDRGRVRIAEDNVLTSGKALQMTGLGPVRDNGQTQRNGSSAVTPLDWETTVQIRPIATVL